MIKYLMITLLLTGCGSGSNVQIDPQARAYYEEFIQLVGQDKEIPGNVNVVDTIPNLDPKPGYETVGLCRLNDPYNIYLLKRFWDHSTDNTKRSLVYHELTHCVLLQHDHSSDPSSYFYWIVSTVSEPELDAQVKSYF